jgi:DNA-binding transcriptional LysR family regulator
MRLNERSVGVAMLPDSAARRGALTMAGEVLPLSDPVLNRELLLCVRKLQSLPEPTKALVQQLRHAAAALEQG